jgi:[ribosomal protein S5]-alanine N-acetyltransferase
VTQAHTSIRLIEQSDAPVLASHLARDAEDFVRWEPDLPDGYFTTAGQARRIEQMLEIHRAGGGWPGVIVADGHVIGQVTVGTILRGPFQKGFLGYWVGVPFQGQGHASRAVNLLLRVMAEELGLYRAEAHTQMENLASHGVLRKNGFRPWGVAHNHIYVNKAWRDEVFWERTLIEGAPPLP